MRDAVRMWNDRARNSDAAGDGSALRDGKINADGFNLAFAELDVAMLFIRRLGARFVPGN